MRAAIQAPPPPVRALRALAAVAAACGAIATTGLFLDSRATWGGYLVGFGFCTGVAIAGPLFLAIHDLTGARWSTSLLPIAEAMTRTMPVAAILGLALLLGVPSLYEWAHPDAVAHDHLLRHKSAWLNVPGFGIRMVACFTLWIWLGHRLIGTWSPDPASRQARIRRSALFMAVLGVTFPVAAIDWFQSLEPHWFSTIYALSGLAGIGLSGIGLLMISAVALRRRGVLRRDDDQLDDLGKLALSLSLFWIYVAFCQYMLIWYTNNPEETPWYEIRRRGGWYELGVVNFVVNWGVPFLALMPKKARRSERVIGRIGALLLVGRLVDLFIAVMPPLVAGGPRLGLYDGAAITGAAAVCALVFLRALGRPAAAGAPPPGVRVQRA
jgi:hypothetical protein